MRIESVPAQAASAAEATRRDAAAPQLGAAQANARVEAAKVRAERLAEEQVRRAEDARARVPEEPASRSRIRVDEASNRYIAQVVNENNEVIKQYPPEAILEFTARFRKLQGLLFDEQA